MFLRSANCKEKQQQEFGCRGYYVDTTGKSTKRIAEYIQNQLKEDQMSDQIRLKEFEDPFAGRK